MLKAPGGFNRETGAKILLEAMSKDKVHLAKFVLDALDGKIVDIKMEGAQTPLILCVLLPDNQIRSTFIEILLQRGATVNCQDEKGRTALSYACEKGDLDTVKTLVRHNADPEVVDSWGNTTLMFAAAAGHPSVVKFLVRAFKRLGLQIDRRNKVGNSAVEVAKFLGHTECVSALANNPKKRQEDEKRPEGNRDSQGGLGCTSNGKYDAKVSEPSRRLELLKTENPEDGTWQPRRRKTRLQSLDSIEEFETEGCFSPPELIFSGVLTPKPPPPHCSNSSAVRELPKPGGKVNPTHHLPPLSQASQPGLYSPRPGKPAARPCASSALGVLLTPLTNSPRGTQRTFNFQDSYYQKRSSLPATLMSPAPPDRSSTPLRKSKTPRRGAASPTKVEALNLKPPAASPTSFSVLSNKLLRRFTFPGFKRGARGFGEDAAVARWREDPKSSSERIPRSETYPQVCGHPQAGSKPSVDGISAVKCEFDFVCRTPPS